MTPTGSHAGVPASLQDLTQIPDQASRCAIGQHPSPDNAPFCIGGIGAGNIDPGHKPQIPVDAVHLDAFYENIGDDHRFIQRWIWIVHGHHSTGGSLS
jgi:hypothetical protein